MVTDGPVDAVENNTREAVLKQLHRATNELYASGSLEECTQLTADTAIDILGFDWCVLIAADEQAGHFEVVATAGDTGLEVGAQPMEIGQGIVGEVFQRGESEIVADATATERGEPLTERIKSAITVPVGDWGVFQALATESDVFDHQDQQLSELLVTPLATTIDRIQTEQRLREQTQSLERQKRQIEALHAFSTKMKTATTYEEIYELYVEAVEEILEIGICTLDVRDGGVLKTRAVGTEMNLPDYYTETPLNQPDSVATETYDRGETVVIDDLGRTGYRAASSEFRSLISVPLGEWGIFQAATTERGAFEETERRVIELLANAADAAVDRIDREQELQQRAREFKQQNERLDQFASRLSHELRNPLSVLEARLSLAQETGETEHFDHVKRSIGRMDRLIDDTLALARGMDIKVNRQEVELVAVASTCWEGIRTPETDLALETHQRLSADADRLGQLLANLFRNAVEHTGDGVTVTVGDLSDGFYVEDDGPGIPEANREQVVAPGNSGLAHGTGLGLAVVKNVAEAHGWSQRLTESDAGGLRIEFRGITGESPDETDSHE